MDVTGYTIRLLDTEGRETELVPAGDVTALEDPASEAAGPGAEAEVCETDAELGDVSGPGDCTIERVEAAAVVVGFVADAADDAAGFVLDA